MTVISKKKWFAEFGMSCMYSRKRIGPRTDLWGTPECTFKFEERLAFINTSCCLFVSNDLNQFRARDNFSSNISRLTQVNSVKYNRSESDLHMQLWSNLSSHKESPEKKSEASTGFEPITSVIPVWCSTDWAMKPPREQVSCQFNLDTHMRMVHENEMMGS